MAAAQADLDRPGQAYAELRRARRVLTLAVQQIMLTNPSASLFTAPSL